MIRAYIALGANLGDPAAQLRAGVDALANTAHTRVTACSRLWRTPAWGAQPQPDYLNAVIAADTALPPEVLLDALLAIERAHGRVRDGARYGPRTLDLDLLLYGEQRVDSAVLQVPHPQLALRAFVLLPLAELAPLLVIPGTGATVTELLAGIDTAGCVALGPLCPIVPPHQRA